MVGCPGSDVALYFAGRAIFVYCSARVEPIFRFIPVTNVLLCAPAVGRACLPASPGVDYRPANGSPP
eukprot:7979163-Pyramimonas_sp.AAC.1